ncbi:hypothetical protein LTR78_010620 [Recurvomyces mirabilis]|uniref:Uncharacterized protein n=1 Tax=Recurvomyces mirabilis TaxID=574656 RepID=A0AAE0WG57_9PEZI|nr:hypothetical protein LTR78_010620 [Recurvomyces mirabilis]
MPPELFSPSTNNADGNLKTTIKTFPTPTHADTSSFAAASDDDPALQRRIAGSASVKHLDQQTSLRDNTSLDDHKASDGTSPSGAVTVSRSGTVIEPITPSEKPQPKTNFVDWFSKRLPKVHNPTLSANGPAKWDKTILMSTLYEYGIQVVDQAKTFRDEAKKSRKNGRPTREKVVKTAEQKESALKEFEEMNKKGRGVVERVRQAVVPATCSHGIVKRL